VVIIGSTTHRARQIPKWRIEYESLKGSKISNLGIPLQERSRERKKGTPILVNESRFGKFQNGNDTPPAGFFPAISKFRSLQRVAGKSSFRILYILARRA
jgi:hypothetical protein